MRNNNRLFVLAAFIATRLLLMHKINITYQDPKTSRRKMKGTEALRKVTDEMDKGTLGKQIKGHRRNMGKDGY